MRDIELYERWFGIMRDGGRPAVAIEEWLRSGILRITSPSSIAETSHPPFFPFVGYANDADDVLCLMSDLRELAVARSDDEASALRAAVVAVISKWDIENSALLPAIRLSFKMGSIFGCAEVCDELAVRARQLMGSQLGVLTGLSDMASSMGRSGRNLVIMLLAKCAEAPRLELLPYLLTRAIESSVVADCQEQREMVLDLMGRYGELLDPNELDAIEALTDVFVAHLRLTESPLDITHAEKFWNATLFLDEELLQELLVEIPEFAPISMTLLNEAKDFSSKRLEASNSDWYMDVANG